MQWTVYVDVEAKTMRIEGQEMYLFSSNYNNDRYEE
jgi:hypothetical protein